MTSRLQPSLLAGLTGNPPTSSAARKRLVLYDE
jgi:hypothetical protein